jgi:hypothetical protein
MNCKYVYAAILSLLVLGYSASMVRAQDDAESPRTRSTSVDVNDEGTRPRLVNDPEIVFEAPVPPPIKRDNRPSISAEPKTKEPWWSTDPRPLTGRPSPFNKMLLGAIDERLGSPYVYGSEGPSTFDCSGFVWSVYKQLGVTFERGSARSLWSRMEPVSEDQQYQFGNLVFFSGLTHVGIVADQNGFYHASRSHGVVYSPFNKYWLARVDGFRHVTAPPPTTAKVAKR